MVLGWFPRFADRDCAWLAEVWLRPIAWWRTFDRGWVVYPGLSVFVPIGLYAIYGFRLMRVPLSLSSGIIRAPPPYRMVNVG